MTELNADQKLLLELVARFQGRANWHKLGRVSLGKLSSPGRFTEELNALIWAGLLVEKPVVEGETLPRLQLSENGKRALELTDAGTKEREG